MSIVPFTLVCDNSRLLQPVYIDTAASMATDTVVPLVAIVGGLIEESEQSAFVIAARLLLTFLGTVLGSAEADPRVNPDDGHVHQ
jgi:hypothetical protein